MTDEELLNVRLLFEFEILPEPLEELFLIGFTANPLSALTFSITGKVATLSIAYKFEENKIK